jgi:Galactose oxidase, central domain
MAGLKPRRLVAGAIAAGVALAVATPPAMGVEARWSKVAAKGKRPSARSDAGLAATSRRRVYLFGGERAGTPLRDLWRLDLRRKRWKRLRPPGRRPRARFGHNLVAERNGTLLLFGGQDESGFFADVWRFNPRHGRWRKLGAKGPAPRYGAGGAVDPRTGSLLITHGFTDDGRFDDTWSLSGTRFTEVSAAGTRPLRRCLFESTVYRGGLYLFAGQSDPVAFRNDLWRFDIAARKWRELKPRRRPSPRHDYASARTRFGWVIHGGDTRDGVARDLWLLDFGRERFARLRPRRRPRARGNHAASAAGSRRVVIFGGTTGSRELADTWVLSLR